MVPGATIVGIVDDDEFFAAGLRALLEELGHVVAVDARTYEDARAMVEGRAGCEVAFIDLMLGAAPSGADLARRAVANGLAVVVMTGGPSLPNDLDGAALLLKPFSREQVAMVLQEMLRRGKLRPALGVAAVEGDDRNGQCGSARRYRERAAELRLAVAQMPNPHVKATLRSVAETYDRLADDIERGDGVGVARPEAG